MEWCSEAKLSSDPAVRDPRRVRPASYCVNTLECSTALRFRPLFLRAGETRLNYRPRVTSDSGAIFFTVAPRKHRRVETRYLFVVSTTGHFKLSAGPRSPVKCLHFERDRHVRRYKRLIICRVRPFRMFTATRNACVRVNDASPRESSPGQ